MKKFELPYAATGHFSKAVMDYVDGSASLRPFYQYVPTLSSFPGIMEARESFEHRDILHRALHHQHEGLDYKDTLGKVIENIDSLKNKNTFTVTTAHQPNLFLGPLYLVYKIISTIHLAKQLNARFSEYHFVPVYWMGSEDHDKEELNHIHLFGKTFTWGNEQEGAFGRMKTDTLKPLIDEIREVLGQSEDAKRCIELLESCYLSEESIAAATTKMLYHFFSGDGLVVIDGDDAGLKKLFIPLMEKELVEQFSFPVVTKSGEVFSRDYTAQIAPRDINLFYLDENIRQRIVKENDGYRVLNTTLSFSREEIIQLLHSHPEKFSPNVVLRPLYQETVLPDVAFLGGGAEVTYWLQLKSLFEAANLPSPMILLRNSVLWIDHNNAGRMHKLDISPEKIFETTDALTKSHLLRQTGDGISLSEEKQTLNELMEYVLRSSVQVDASLKGAVEAEKVKMQKSLELIEDKLRKAAKKKEESSIHQIKGVKEKLFPANGLQERYDNFLSYYLRYGDQFFEILKLNLDPLVFKFIVLIEE